MLCLWRTFGSAEWVSAVRLLNRLTIGNINKEVKYSIGIGGFTAEYTLPFINKIAVSPGVVIGGGSIEIDAYRNSGNFEWDEVWTELSNDEELI